MRYFKIKTKRKKQTKNVPNNHKTVRSKNLIFKNFKFDRRI
jgi:hypothetical protein